MKSVITQHAATVESCTAGLAAPYRTVREARGVYRSAAIKCLPRLGAVLSSSTLTVERFEEAHIGQEVYCGPDMVA